MLSSFVKGFGTMASLFPGGMLKNATHVSRKSCIIQPIRRRLRHSWSDSTFVCHMHQAFSQRSVGVTSEAETRIQNTVARVFFLSCLFSLKAYCVYEDTSKDGVIGHKVVCVFNHSRPFKMAKKKKLSLTFPRSMSTVRALRQRTHIAKWVLFHCWLHFNGLKSLVFKPQFLKTCANDKFSWPHNTAASRKLVTAISTG